MAKLLLGLLSDADLTSTTEVDSVCRLIWVRFETGFTFDRLGFDQGFGQRLGSAMVEMASCAE